MLVPVDAVYFEGGNSYLYTYDLDESAVHKIQVETGIYDSEQMEIISGIDADDLVVDTWSSELYEGAKAQYRDADGQIDGESAPAGTPQGEEATAAPESEGADGAQDSSADEAAQEGEE